MVGVVRMVGGRPAGGTQQQGKTRLMFVRVVGTKVSQQDEEDLVKHDQPSRLVKSIVKSNVPFLLSGKARSFRNIRVLLDAFPAPWNSESANYRKTSEI